MFTGMLYNAFVCLSIFVAAVFTFYKLKTAYPEDIVVRMFSYFWLSVGIMWFFSGLRTIFAWWGLENYDRAVFYIVTLFMLLQIMFLSAYVLFVRISSPIARKTIVAYFVLSGLLYLFLFFKNGITMSAKTYWGTEWEPCGICNQVFRNLLFIPVVVVMAVNLVHGLLTPLIKRSGFNWKLIISHIAIIIYSAVGYIDARGEVTGWKLLVIRIFLLISCLLTYLCYTGREYDTGKETER